MDMETVREILKRRLQGCPESYEAIDKMGPEDMIEITVKMKDGYGYSYGELNITTKLYDEPIQPPQN